MPPPLFHCALCAKSYAKATELETHENSYDHQHKKRLKEMKAMTRNPVANLSKRRDESSSEMKSVALPESRTKTAASNKGRSDARAPARGFGGAVKGAEVKEEEVQEDNAGETGYVTVRGPVRWENLGKVGDVVDLDAMRPREMQRFVEQADGHFARRRERGRYDEVWRRARAKRSGSASQDGDEEEARPVGLGA